MKVGDYIRPKNVFKDRYIRGYIAEYTNGNDEFLVQWNDRTSSWMTRGNLFEHYELDKDGKFAIVMV